MIGSGSCENPRKRSFSTATDNSPLGGKWSRPNHRRSRSRVPDVEDLDPQSRVSSRRFHRRWRAAATAVVRPSARSVGDQKAIVKFQRLVDLVARHEFCSGVRLIDAARTKHNARYSGTSQFAGIATVRTRPAPRPSQGSPAPPIQSALRAGKDSFPAANPAASAIRALLPTRAKRHDIRR